MARARRGKQKQPAANQELLAGLAHLRSLTLFSGLAAAAIVRPVIDDPRILRGELGTVTSNGVVLLNERAKATAQEWAYTVAHCLLHLGLGHLREQRENPAAWNAACDVQVARMLDAFSLGQPPAPYAVVTDGLPGDLDSLYRWFCTRPAAELTGADLVFEPSVWTEHVREPEWEDIFAGGLRQAVRSAIQVAGAAGAERRSLEEARPDSPAERARGWFLEHFPLIGAVAASFRLVWDLDACRALDIQVAAVDIPEKTIYLNPVAGLTPDELRFVVAHEILHAALRHDLRCETRDPYLWNVAADYVLNQWLFEMEVGTMPTGCLHDPSLAGMSAEEVYDRIVGDLRRLRRLVTFRGRGVGDMISGRPSDWWQRGDGLALDDWYRQALAQGLDRHVQQRGRGLIPAGLVEEIRAQALPPIPWEVKLARWLDQFFPTPETRRSYARPSRRQSATPDIPRASVVKVSDWDKARTFGVVIDTSGSMTPKLLAEALGTVASYCASREVPAVRVVFCDARAYDQGFMDAEEVAGRVRVIGRGGTVLQPGVDLLEHAKDFPTDGPILVITDAYCEPTLRVRRNHAFVVPFGARLPFPARGPIFTIPPDRAQ